MASTGVSVTVHGGGFEPGEKVGLSQRFGDNYLPGQALVKTAKVRTDGEIRFADVAVGRYWVHRFEEPHRALAVHAKARQPGVEKPDAATIKRRLEATRPVTGQGAIITGPVDSSHVQRDAAGGEFALSRFDTTGLSAPGDLRTDLAGEKRARAVEGFDPGEAMGGSPVGHPTPEGVAVGESRAQEDARGLEQQSATVTGTATPVGAAVLRQDQIDPGVPQASATPLGVATPLGSVDAPAVKPARKPAAPKAAPAKKSAAAKPRKRAPRKQGK